MRSKFEEAVAAKLKAAGHYPQYEPCKFAYTQDRKYTPDFGLVAPDGRPFYVETKGFFTAADRSKMLAVKYRYPALDLRLVFQRAKNTLSKTSKTTYAQWAERHGFVWAEGAIPIEWVDQPGDR